MLLPVEVTPSVVAAESEVQSIRPAPVNAAKPVVVVSVLPVMFVPATSVVESLAAIDPCVATPPTVTVCARMKPLSAVMLILPASPVAPVATSALKVTFWLAWMVWLPLLVAVPTVMLPLLVVAVKVPAVPVAVPTSTLSSVSEPVP